MAPEMRECRRCQHCLVVNLPTPPKMAKCRLGIWRIAPLAEVLHLPIRVDCQHYAPFIDPVTLEEAPFEPPYPDQLVLEELLYQAHKERGSEQ